MQIHLLTISIVNDLLGHKSVAIMLSINALNNISWLNSLDSCISIRHFDYSCTARGYYLKKTTCQLICTEYTEREVEWDNKARRNYMKCR